MTNMKKTVLYLLLSILTMIMIFLFSAQPFSATMKTSGHITKPIENYVKSKADTRFTDEAQEKAYMKKAKNDIVLWVRKSAHIMIFALLALFLYLFFSSIGLNYRLCNFYTAAFCFMYGASDELHQKFVKGRNSKVTDVFVDLFGAVLMLLVIYVLRRVKINRRKR